MSTSRQAFDGHILHNIGEIYIFEGVDVAFPRLRSDNP
jgi:hypothetical protein